ncbi:unnamed protein product [Adineta ricciae]|uniref:Countin-like protein n=1 Tax=Adineta ricciae TaxID=249248 RepID=A0A815HTM9_ADIRI|nr:unnamed protein product [Adineta ricciae]CAF1356948.1 unnamed protein product [Adineta ricciae]
MYVSLIVFVTIIVLGKNVHAAEKMPYTIERVPPIDERNDVGPEICRECIKESVSAINVLLNLILDEGIIGSCGDLCGALANKTSSKGLGDVCLVVCNVVGIGEFIRLLEHTDLDPIWYCQIADLCPINDHGDAKFVYFHMIPPTGRVGTEFIIDCSFTSKNGTGPGMLSITIVTPQNQSASNDFLLDAKKPGIYDQRIAVKTFDRDCNSPTDSCNGFPTGTYNVTAYLCDGECGSHHPHSSIYDVGHTSFVVTP